jgi:hypothetical protein
MVDASGWAQSLSEVIPLLPLMSMASIVIALK